MKAATKQKRRTTKRPSSYSATFAADVGKALRRAAKQARRVARAYGTPIYVSKNGKVVALKP